MMALGGAGAAGAIDFETAVQPVLEENCVRCHGATEAKGGLRLDTAGAMLAGGDLGPAVTPGDPAESELNYRAGLPPDDFEAMPPEGEGEPLSEEQVAALHAWVAAGAPWPEGRRLTAKPRGTHARYERAMGRKEVVDLKVYPPDVNLDAEQDQQSFIAIAIFGDDSTLDVTSHATVTFPGEAVATVSGNVFKPAHDGEGEAVVAFGAHERTLPVKVANSGRERPVSFQLDVMPVLTKAGCNTGGCHGASRGKDGFMLSLFGYDPEGDYHRITREQATRRVNLALPHHSLLAEKATGSVQHTGGKLIEEGGEFHRTLLRWLEAGAPKDPEDVARPVGLEVYPPEIMLEGEGARQRMTVRATYSDGTDRDVTDLTVFVTNDEQVAAVSEQGVIEAGQRGDAFILARFDVFAKGCHAIVIPENLPYERPGIEPNNYIDELVGEKLRRMRMLPSKLCSDEEFLRRVTIDVTGQLPSEQEYHDFLADERPDKRARLVDELLQRKEFTEMWVMKFAELLQIRSDNNNGMPYKAALLYYNWLQDNLADNRPINEIVYDLISSTGGTFQDPRTNFYQVEQDDQKLAENVAQVFMGMRIQCAQCHNHPFDRWTMDDYYGFTAFFTQIGRKRAHDPRESIVFNRNRGEVKHPVTKEKVKPKFLGGETPEIGRGDDRREVLADWLTSPENPYFARNLANIVWAHFMGRGIIEPVDDVRVSNPPSNPALLNALGERFTDYDYDFKRLVRDICTSRTYQLSTRPNETNRLDQRNFSKASIRRLRAEVLLDVITQVTGAKNKFRGLPEGARAVQIADGNTTNYFLTTFGRAERTTVCSCEVKMEPNLGQALHLLNGAVTNQRIQEGGVIDAMFEDGLSPPEMVDRLYVRCYSREPTPAERRRLAAEVETASNEGERKEVMEDIFWAMLNSKEFLFNH